MFVWTIFSFWVLVCALHAHAAVTASSSPVSVLARDPTSGLPGTSTATTATQTFRSLPTAPGPVIPPITKTFVSVPTGGGTTTATQTSRSLPTAPGPVSLPTTTTFISLPTAPGPVIPPKTTSSLTSPSPSSTSTGLSSTASFTLTSTNTGSNSHTVVVFSSSTPLIASSTRTGGAQTTARVHAMRGLFVGAVGIGVLVL